MPSPKRWFHLSRDFFDDPEVWELIETHGYKAAFAWQLILAGLEITDNKLPFGPTAISLASRKLKTHTRTILHALSWASVHGWLQEGPLGLDGKCLYYEATNYWKYHKRPDGKGTIPRLFNGSETAPSYPILSEPKKDKDLILMSNGTNQENPSPRPSTSRTQADRDRERNQALRRYDNTPVDNPPDLPPWIDGIGKGMPHA